MSRLTDARTKLDWAKKNLNELASELNAWKEAHGERPPFTTRAEPDMSDYSFSIVIDKVEDMPPSWAHRTGNIVNDLRSSLNYVAWQMFQVGTETNIDPKKQERIQFPIVFENDTKWLSVVGDQLRGVLPNHLAVVQKYQPYQLRKIGEDPKDHPFATLAELSRSDKHRTPAFFYSRHSWYKFRILRMEGYVHTRLDTPPIGTLLLAKPGTELVRVRGYPLVGSPTQAKVIVEIMGASVIGFESGVGLTSGLLEISKTVEKFLVEVEPLM